MSPTGEAALETIPFGLTLAGIEVELSCIRFDFIEKAVEFAAPFFLLASEEDEAPVALFDPWEKKGDLNLLWPLVDRQASRIHMTEDSFSLFFDDGTVLKCLQQGTEPELVLIWGGERPEGGIELTRYPADLYPPTAPPPRLVPGQDIVLRPPISARKTGA